MSLSSELISQFVKVTNDKKKEKTESTSYCTIVEYNGSKYARLDGSELLTPIKSTVSISDGDRATVTIKDHTATVTGNLSDPSASSGTVTQIGNKISEFEIVIADKVSTKELDAEKARIDDLVADNVVIKDTLIANKAEIDNLVAEDVTINGILTASNAEIENLKTTKLDASVADITYATIDSLEAADAKINNLQATYGDFEVLTTNKFTAIDGVIDNLEANKLDAETARITYATITDLNAAKADISILDTDVADINTLIFGSASGSSIQTSFANAVIAQLGNAQIKSAMIENVSADKITAGDIITNNVRVMSEDGKLLISDETIQISDKSRVRVQIGKDAAGDYSINIWDADGNLMFSEGGITDNAIKEAIIRNDMVSDDANISAHKLDIDSLFTVINEDGTHTIKSSQIYMSDEEQTLDVAFTQMTTNVNGIQDNVTSQGTAIGVIQGQISSKIWQQDITNAVDGVSSEMNTKYSSLEQTVDGISTTVANHTTQISNKADSSTVVAIQNEVSTLEQTVEGFKTTVSETYVTKTEFDDLEIGGRNLVRDSDMSKDTDYWSFAGGLCTYTFANGYCEIYRTEATDSRAFNSQSSSVNPLLKPNDLAGGTFTLSLEIKALDGYTVTDASTLFYRCNTTDLSTGFQELAIKLGNITSGWTKRYETFTFGEYNFDGSCQICLALGNIANTGLCVRNIKLERGDRPTDWTAAPEDLETRVSNAETSITQNADSIRSVATRTTAVENKFDNYSTTEEMTSAIEQSAEGIRSSVSATYATKSALSTVESTANAAKKQLWHSADGTSGTAGYVAFAQLDITGTYANRPIYLGLANRGTVASEVEIRFANVNGKDPALSTIRENGEIGVWITKISTSKWYVIAKKSEGYDTIYVNDYSNNNAGITVSWINIHYASLPTSNIHAATKLVGSAEASTITTKSEFTQLSDNVTAAVKRIGTNETNIASLQLTADGLTSRVSATETDVDTALTNATNAQADINDLEIGGRNLITGTTDEYTSIDVGQYYATIAELNIADLMSKYNLQNGDTLICSVYFKSNSTKDLILRIQHYNSNTDRPNIYGSHISAGSEGLIAKKFTLDASYASLQILMGNNDSATITETTTEYYKCLKLEKGNRATDWTPAPEDIDETIEGVATDAQEKISENAERIYEAESLIQQLSDSISMLVVDESGESLMTQESGRWVFSMAQYTDTLDSLSTGLNNLTTSVGNTQNTVNILNQAVNDLGVLTDYVVITTYDSQPCIELGEIDSGFKLRITNTAIHFLEDSSVVAYISDKKLYIEQAEILNELQLGSFVWKIRSNGNMGLLWKGGS